MEYIASGAQADIYRDGTNAIKLFKNILQKEDIEKLRFYPDPDRFEEINLCNIKGNL